MPPDWTSALRSLVGVNHVVTLSCKESEEQYGTKLEFSWSERGETQVQVLLIVSLNCIKAKNDDLDVNKPELLI